MTVNVTDVLSVLSSQSLQQSMSSIISPCLTFTVIFLSLILLHDTLGKSKHLHASWWSLIPFSRDHLPSLPGPWWNLPLLGYLPWLGSKPHVTLWKLSQRYGSVYQIRFGSRRVVVLNGRMTIRAAFIQQGDLFSARPDFPSFAVFCENQSLAFSSPHAFWTTQRKAALRVLGMFTDNTKYPIEALIHRHAVALTDRLLSDSSPVGHGHAPAAVDPYDAIESAVVAIMFEVCFGEAGDGDQQLYSHMMHTLHEMRDAMPAVQSVDIMPWLAPFLRGPLRRYTDSLLLSHQLNTNKVDAMVAAGVPDKPTCIVHALHHACLTEAADDSQRARIMAVVQDFVGAGSEVVVHFIHWAILYAAKYPSIVQEGVRDEIKRTIGWLSVPVAADRGRMPYTEACMWEIVRHACLSPLSLPHTAVQDAVIAGCEVKAGTVMFANLYSTGWDPEVWGDPHTFRPQRFLTADGSRVDREILSQFLCFGAGRRRCVGAQFAKIEMFLFFVVLMQKCTFHAQPGQVLPTDGTFVLTNRAKSYRVLVQASATANDDNI